MSEKFKLDRKIGFQNTFNTKCINVKIDSIGRSIILRSKNATYNCHGCADRESFVRGVQFRPPFLFLVYEGRDADPDSNTSHYRPASETPFKWHFAGVPMMASH